jgi:hypothetical protein
MTFTELQNPTHVTRLAWIGLSTVLLVCALAYLPGLQGPFVFDDTPNLFTPLQAWLQGDISWREVVFGNASGLVGRPLSMLSFLANAAMTGLDPVPFKATNLGIHLLCGVLLYALLARLLPRDPWLKQRSALTALLITSLWLLHPMQVSTVLYVVQRMAQLSALFTLAGLLVFVRGRQCLETGRVRTGLIHLFLALPALTVAAILCKENGALLPLLCAVIELGYFRTTSLSPRPRSVQWFFVLSLLLPGAVVLAWYGLHPQKIMGGYDGRLFTLGDRLLTQPRALMHYMSALLLPSGPSLGVYTDDFMVSRGLLNPVGTLWSILGLALLIIAAWAARVRIPAFFTGIGLYLAGHVMESTVFPLEIYFEHRNYLPSAGFFLGVVGLASWGLSRLLPLTDHPQRTHRGTHWAAVALLLVLSLATWARAGVWSSWDVLTQQGIAQHPLSVRANIDATRVYQAEGRNDKVQQILDNMAGFDDPEARHVSAINSVVLQCTTEGATTAAAVAKIRAIAGAKLELGEMLMMENLVRFILENDCQNLDKPQLASIMVWIVDAAPQSPALTQLWRSRFYAAKLYASSGHVTEAQKQLELAWGTGAADPAVGAFLVQVQLARGDTVGARQTLPVVASRIATWDRRGHAKMAELSQALEAR